MFKVCFMSLEEFLSFASSGLSAGIVVGLVVRYTLKSIRAVFGFARLSINH